MAFINEDFLLQSEQARELFHVYAEREPIYDFHCHLSAQDIAEDRRFENLAELWLEGDHYKWRAMRANGVPEVFCTGNADPFEKFEAWCRTVPNTLRNPLYHWSHLELKRYFGIDVLISEGTAREIWDEAGSQLKTAPFSARGFLEKFKVKLVATTDDPIDGLACHEAIRNHGLGTAVVPTFRPDMAFKVDEAEAFNAWIRQLESAVDGEIGDFGSLLGALEERHTVFHEAGGRLSDHGLERCFYAETSKKEGERVFQKARGGGAVGRAEKEAFGFLLMREIGRWNAQRGWTMQLHVGARRNDRSRLYCELGADAGGDSMGEPCDLRSMSRFLDSLDSSGDLPRTVIYNSNPADNYPLASLAGSFQSGGTPSKVQLGSAWWFLDHKRGIEAQLNALSDLGLLSHFVGMVTDSRSFMSYPRHEYFRRVLCNLLGDEMASGELPNDMALVGRVAKEICFANAARFVGIPYSG